MSILTSAVEQNEARVKLAGLPREQLERDLTFWAVAKADHKEAWEAASAKAAGAREHYLEADTWVDLVADELALRRRAEGRP